MAKVIKKNSDTYLKEKESFLRELQHFHDTRGTPCRHVPKIGGKEIDLYLLYCLVTSNGGWVKVNSRNQWNNLLKEFHLPKNCVNVSVALKQIYLRYLDRYEKAHFLGETHNAIEDDEDTGGGRHKRWSNVRSTQPSVPLAYNHSQHQITESVRASSALSKDLYSGSEYDKLALSLLCPLPNEQDFALNVCTLLSNEFRAATGPPTGIRLARHTRLLRYLLAHAGVFADDTLRTYYTDNYRRVRAHSLEAFWDDAVEDRSILRMMREMVDEDSRLVDERTHLRRIRAREKRRQENSGAEKEDKRAETNKDETQREDGADVKLDVGEGGDIAAAATAPVESKHEEDTANKSGEVGRPGEDCTGGETATTRRTGDSSEEAATGKTSGDPSTEQKCDDDPKEEMCEPSSDGTLVVPPSGKARECTSKADDPLCDNRFESADIEFLSDDEESISSEQGPKRARLRVRPEDKGLFALGRGLGTREWVGQRVLQIATVLRNFTFNDENNALLSRDLTFLRFMVLCCSSNWSCLRQLGLDMFCNIATEITMDETLAPVLFDIISQGLGSEDRAAVLSCIEILNKLGQVEKNEDILLRSLHQKVYNQVCTLLTLHDIMLLIHTLECVYSLSSLGERACNAIMRVHGAMDVLVSLVTVEAQSFGPKACILMRVVETIDPNSTGNSEEDTPAVQDTPTLTPLSQPAGPPTGLNAPTFTLPMALAPVAVPVPLSQAIQCSPSPSPMTPMVRHRPPMSTSVISTGSAPIMSQQGQQFPPRHTYRVITPNKITTAGTASITPSGTSIGSSSGVSSSSTAGSSGNRPPEENGEMFATQWLRANFEHASLPGRAIEQAELYKQYINAASRAGRRGVIAPLHFPRVVRSVFGAQIGPKQVIPAAPPGSTAPPPPPIHVYEGIQVRGKQPIITQTIAIAPQPSHQQNLASQQHPNLSQHQQTSQQAFVQQQNSQQQQLQNPISPILKAQLSAPPKPQAGGSSVAPLAGSQNTPTPSPTPGCSNSARTKAHPHLSQALLGAGGTPGPSGSTPSTGASMGDPTSTSLIKSLLANKVGPEASSSQCVPSSSTQPSNTASQVTQRQQQAQKMLSQSTAPSSAGPSGSTPGGANTSTTVKSTQQQMRLNGVTINMQQVTNHVIENSIDVKQTPGPGSSNTPATAEQPPSLSSQPPPLAPLSSSKQREGEESSSSALVDGTSVVVNGGISNSINLLADTSDQQYKENIAKQSLMLVDLLEKSIGDKDPPTMNGAIRIGEKGLDLFTSIETKSKLAAQQSLCAPGTPTSVHSSNSGGVIRRVSSELESQHRANGTPMLNGAEQVSAGMKRPRSQDAQDSSEAPATKKVHVNGDVNPASSVEEEQEENNVKASSTAANLYAALAADVLEDEELLTEAQPPPQSNQGVLQSTPGMQGTFTPAQGMQGVLQGASAGSNQAGNIIVTGSGGNGRQQILVTGGQGGSLPQRLSMMGQHYVVTQQPQGHSGGQTLLVAQQAGQQGSTGSKTIIILQPSSPSPSHPSSSKTTVSSIASSSTFTTSSNSNQKMIVSSAASATSVVHRTPTPLRPQPAGTNASVIKPVPDTRPGIRSSLAQQSGFQAQFIQQTQQQQNLNQQQRLNQQTQQQQQRLNQQTQQQQRMIQPTQQQQRLNQQQAQTSAPASGGQFICEWRGCMRNFKSANEVYMHACECHCPVTPSAEIQCLWERCDVLRRKRFSHMTHLYDRHCNPDVLKIMAVRRRQLGSSGKTEIPPPPAPTPHPGYAPNAAFNAIKRHALEFVNPKELQDDNEGPVTKSIRLTSSLILRNLVIYSTTGRRHLVSHEPHLASVALSNVESSKTIAQVLFDMNDAQSRR